MLIGSVGTTFLILPAISVTAADAEPTNICDPGPAIAAAWGNSDWLTWAAAPSIPPLAKTPGLQNFDLTQWFGVYVPSGTPNVICQKIQRDIVDVLKMPEVKDALLKQGAQPGQMSMSEFQAFSASESKKFEAIVKSAKIEQNWFTQSTHWAIVSNASRLDGKPLISNDEVAFFFRVC